MRKLYHFSCALVLGLLVQSYQVQAQGASFGDAASGMGNNDKSNTSVAAGTNIATGTIAPTIPLLTLPGVSGGVGLGLRYTAGAGVKVNDIASEVGLGWTLMGGGSITREVKGQPDDGELGWFKVVYYRNYFTQMYGGTRPGFPTATAGNLATYFKNKNGNSYINSSGYTVTFGANESWFGEYLYSASQAVSFSDYQWGQYTAAYRGPVIIDTEPDVYTVMLPTGGLQFVFDGSGNPVVLQGQNIKIETLGLGARGQDDYLQEFRVTTSDGTQYLFGSPKNDDSYKEKLKVSSATLGQEPIPSKVDYECTYKWLLKKIITPIGEEINYEYNAPVLYEIVTNNYIQQDFVYALRGGQGNPNGSPIQSYTSSSFLYPDPWVRKYTIRTTASSSDCKQPATISSTQGTIEFVYQNAPRQDIGGGVKALNNLRLRDKKGMLVKQIDFVQHYTQAAQEAQISPVDVYHLLLDKIIDKGAGCNYVEAYRFSYNPLVFCRNTASKDDWGYFNNSPVPSNGELVGGCTYAFGSVAGFTRPGRIRQPLGDFAQAMLLQSITNTQGGVQSFEYELHTANLSLSPIDIVGSTLGGLRIKRIVQYDGINHTNDIIDTFAYQTPNGESSGSCGDMGLYAKLKFVHGQTYNHSNGTPNTFGPHTEADIRQVIPDCSYFNANANDTRNLDSYYLLRSDASLYQYASDYIDYKYVVVDHGSKGKTQYEFTTWADIAHRDYTDDDTRLQAGGKNPCADDPLHTSRKPAMLPLPFSLALKGLDMQYVGGGSTADFPCRTSRAMERGLLLRMTQLSSTDQPVAVTTNEYDFAHPGTTLPAVSAVVVKPDLEVLGFTQNFNYFEIYYYQQQATWCPLVKTTQVVYDQQAAGNAGKTLTSVTDIAYTHFFPSKVTKYITTGATTATTKYVTEFRRAQDFPGGDADQTTTPGLLRKAGMMEPVIEQEDYLDQPNGTSCAKVPKGAAFSEYKLINASVLPYQTYAARLGLACFTPATTAQNGGTWTLTRDPNYELISTITGYTLDNRPVNTRDRSGISQAVIWGYDHTLPIATVTNGTASTNPTGAGLLATAAHTSWEEDGQNGTDGDGWSVPSLWSTTEAKTGRRSARIVINQSPYSSGKQLTLPAGTNRHGKMVYSAWVKIPSGVTSSTATCLVVTGQGANSGYQQTCFDVYPGQDWKYVEATIDLDESKWQNGLSNTDNLQLFFYQWSPQGSELLVDELRIHRADALMQTTTYTPLVGKTSTTDPSGVTTYYTYDNDNYPRLVLNQKHDIVQRTQQHLAGQTTRPSADFTIPAIVTQGCTATMVAANTACAGFTYTWDFGDGSRAVNGSASQNHSYTAQNTYTVSLLVSNTASGAASRVTRNITVVDAFYTDISPGDTDINLCDNPTASVTLTAFVPAAVCQTVTYQWQYSSSGSNWINIPNGTAPSLTRRVTAGTQQIRCVITIAGLGDNSASPTIPIVNITGYYPPNVRDCNTQVQKASK